MHKSPLDKIRVASPCNMEWRWMSGNDRVRFCRLCSFHVYNLSAMTKEEIENLILKTEGRLCVRYYQRQDGTILTQDCPEGLRAWNAKWASARNHLIAATVSVLGYLGFIWGTKSEPTVTREARESYSEQIPSPEVKDSNVGHVFMGVVRPNSLNSATVKNEKFIRDRARFRVIPVLQSVNGIQAQGDAVVKVQISPTGEVVKAILIKGNPNLREPAEEAARRWQFEPTIINGVPVKVVSKLTFRFNR